MQTTQNLTINDYLNILKHGSGEYKISFKDITKFYKDVKNKDEVFYWFGDGLNECDTELANIVSCFIRPYLPPYTKLVLKTIYLKYQRQERPTHDCPSSFLQAYIKQLAFDPIRKTGFDFIEVPHIHGEKKFDIIRISPIDTAKEFLEESSNIILPDQGAADLIKDDGFFPIFKNFFICDKERKENGEIITKLPEITNNNSHFVIIDDIIAGGDSIINVIDLLYKTHAKQKNIEITVDVYCIFLMSDYGYNNIKNRFSKVEIKPIFDLRHSMLKK